MSLLSMVEAKLPPGFRFHPRDDELVCDYLQRKVSALAGGGRGHGEFPQMMLIEVDLNNCEPWDLPETACVGCVGGKEWYFFSLPDRKYATGQRTNRATLSGYWKATGKDRQVARKGVLVGMRKTLVFYQGRAPRGKKTEWVLHEFRMEGAGDPTKLSYKGDWVLCRVFYKSRGTSPKPSIGETSFDDTGCSFLPPLTDTYIAFDQAPLSNNRGFEQVPCFSSFSPDPIPLPATLAAPSTLHTNFGGLSSLSSNSFNTLACDEKVIKAVLNHLTKLEGGQNRKDIAPHLPQGSSESYLTKTGLNSVWHPFQN